MKKEIVLVYDNQLPTGSANATRIVSFAHLFQELGYKVVLLGTNNLNLTNCKGFYEGLEYELLSFKEMRYTGIKSPIRTYYLKRHLEKWLDERNNNNGIAAIFYSSRNGLSTFFLKYTKKSGIPVIYNHVEWHLRSMFSGKYGLFSFIQNRFELHFVLDKIQNIVAISSYLQNYYNKKNCNTIRVPTIVNMNNYSSDYPFPNNDKLVLAYAGKPGKKDAIINVISAINLLGVDKERIEFRIFGLTEQELLNNYDISESERMLLGRQVFCYGKIPYEQVQDELKKADFTILLRKNWRNANAGFPTKVGESMASCVPVIANLTGDIGLYLHDGIEGLVCLDETVSSCVNTLRRALALSKEEKAFMRIMARKQAENSFNYLSYLNEMDTYLNSILHDS